MACQYSIKKQLKRYIISVYIFLYSREIIGTDERRSPHAEILSSLNSVQRLHSGHVGYRGLKVQLALYLTGLCIFEQVDREESCVSDRT